MNGNKEKNRANQPLNILDITEGNNGKCIINNKHIDTLNKIGSSDLSEAKKFAIAHELKADLPAPQICPASTNTLDIVTKEIEDFLNGKRKHFAEEEKKPKKKRQKNIRKKHQKIIIFQT